MPIAIWIGSAVLVGILGRKTFLGFLGTFVLSLVLSPLVPLVIIVVVSLDRKFQKRVDPVA